MRRGRGAIAWLAALAWGAGIFYLSSIPAYDLTPPPFPHADKLVHFGLYFVLGVFLCAAVQTTPLRLGVIVGAAIVLAALYGASDEWHQTYVVGRDSDIADWLADLLGAAAGVTLAALVYRRRHGDRARLRREESGAR